MPDIDLPFTRGEYAERLSRVRAAMDEAGIGLLLVTDPSNMHWLTGYDGWSFYVHQGVLVPPEGEPVFWGRMMDAAGALRTAYMTHENIVGYPDDYVMSTTAHAMQHLGWLIRERGWEGLALATEQENYYYTARAHAVLVAEFGREPADATGLVNWQRAVKSETELRYMRRAARISEAIHHRVLELMEPGRRKNEIAAEIYRTAIWGSDEDGVAFGGDYPAIAPLMPTGKDASAAHLTWDDTAFARGAGTFFEISGCHRRYHAPLCRTIFLGEPPAEMRAAEEAVLEGTAEAIEAARPGNTAGDVAHAFYSVLARHGIAREGRCGYPIGLSYPPDWGERTFSLRPSDETVLRPGMTFHFMPAIWMEDWGLEITEPLLVAESGPAECLCQYPRQLFVKP